MLGSSQRGGEGEDGEELHVSRECGSEREKQLEGLNGVDDDKQWTVVDRERMKMH